VGQLGRNVPGELLEPGRVADCHLGLLLPNLPPANPRDATTDMPGDHMALVSMERPAPVRR